MIRSLVESVTNFINVLPTKNGISDTISQETIIEDKPKFYLISVGIYMGIMPIL